MACGDLFSFKQNLFYRNERGSLHYEMVNWVPKGISEHAQYRSLAASFLNFCS